MKIGCSLLKFGMSANTFLPASLWGRELNASSLAHSTCACTQNGASAGRVDTSHDKRVEGKDFANIGMRTLT